MTRKILLENVQVGVHGELKAKLINKDGVENKEFLSMHEEMNVHFTNDQMTSVVPYHPHEGQVCVGKVGTVWHRVRVDGKMSMKCGLYASCFLIDEGRKEHIPVPCLRQIPPRFAKLPHQIKQLALDGIKPLSLQISPDDLMVYERSVIKWDSSAVKFISDHVKAAVTVKVKVVSQSADGVFSVIMYLYTRSGNRVCLNDALVDQRYAVPLDHDDTPMVPVQNQRQKQGVIGSLRMLKIAPDDDGIHDYQAKSDVEQINTRDKLFDRGCITDTEAVSALSHRLLPRLVNQSYQKTGEHVTKSNERFHNLTQGYELQSDRSMVRNQELIKRTDILNSLCSSISSRGYLSNSAKNLHDCETQNKSSCRLDASSNHQTNSLSYHSQSEVMRDSDSLVSENICRDHQFEPRGVKNNMMYASRSKEDTANNETSPLSAVGRVLSASTSVKSSVGRGSAVAGRGALFRALSSSNESLRLINTNNSSENTHHERVLAKKETILNDQSIRIHDILDLDRSTNKQADISPPYAYEKQINAKKSISDIQRSVLRPHASSSVDDKKEPIFPPSYESGNESSVSFMSAVAASVTGQLQAFTKSRRPQETLNYSSDSRVLNVSENASNNRSPKRHTDKYTREITTKTDPVKCLPSYQSSSDTDSPTITLQNRVMEARKRASAESRREIPKISMEDSVLAALGNGSLTHRKTEMLGKFSGEKLMRELASGASGCSQIAQGLESPVGKQKPDVPGLFGKVDNVLVHGKALKKPIYSIEGFPFINEVFKHWESNNFISPKLIQSYGWPAVMSGRHIAAISPQGSGKTMTYLYSLMTYLSESNMYRELPTGMGPLVIILAKSWRKAELVHHTAQQIRQGNKSKILMVYGGGLEGNRALELVDGCDILVTTPPSLKRMLEKGYTDLRRLCHLVIDDCDQVLNTFHVEINYIKSEYSLVMQNEIRQLECPRQILVFGSQWNEINCQFTENVLSEPILVITSPFEAAIYGRVRQIPHICKRDRRISKVIGLLQNIVETEHRIIIFSSSKDDIRFIVEGLRAFAYNLIVVTEHMELYDVKAVADDWARGARLLVCSDNHVMDMNIVDATVVIHYDLPDSKTKFGNRMSCMRQHFYNFTGAKQKKRKIDPMSHLLITAACSKQVRTIQELLKRSGAEMPIELKAFLAGMVEQREQDDNKELCYQLLAYGTCRDNWRCGCRHIVIPASDTSPETDWLPSEGQVKVLVTHVNDSDASHFYVRLLSITHEDGTMDQPTLTYAQLVIDLECWYKKLENQTRHTAPYTGELCGYQDRGVFYRVQILDIPNMNTHGKGTGSIEVSVKFVDIGKDMDIDLNKLYVLPMHLKKVPFQAVEVFVCRVKPVDKDPEWTVRASLFINELLYGKELEGKIVLRLGGILWLDPLVERVLLGQTGTIINRSYVHNELVRNGFANENPTHLEKLYKLCEGKIRLPRALLVKTKMSQILQTDSLPLCRQYHDVHVSSVTSPDKFFIQRREKNSELEELMDQIAEYVHGLEADDGLKQLESGQYCLAQYESFDKRWYRARVMAVLEDAYTIYFADFGDLDTVPTEKVKEFPVDKFFDLPLQAIECRLAGVCTDKNHEKNSGDALWDLTHFVNGDLKSLVVMVKSQTEAEFAGRNRFVVDMFDTNGSEDLNIAQELLYRHLVFASQENSYDDLFPKPSGSKRKIYPSPLQKVPDMVALIYLESDSDRCFELANQLLNLIKSSVSRSSESAHPSMISSLQCLIQLVSRINKAEVEAVIQKCILELLNTGDKICEEFLQTNCLSSVVRCLEMESNSSMQGQAAEFISGLCTKSTKIRTDIQNHRSNILYTLSELFECSDDDLTQGSICKAFTALCSGSDSVFQYLMEKSVCSKLKQILLDTDKHEVQESVILLLSALSDHDEMRLCQRLKSTGLFGEGLRSHNDLKRESLIEAIVRNLKSTSCNKCIQHSVEFCAHYASTRRKHKTHLLEVEMVPVLNRIIQLDIQSTTKQHCKDLVSSLVVKFPSEPMAGVHHPIDRNNQITDSEVPPPVYWCQTTFVVQLSLKIKEATCSQNSFIFTERTVEFRDTVKGIKYAFHLDLFDKITPAKCRVAVKAHEVLVSLHKLVKGRWTRLLRSKKKPQWIFVDHERYVDSSSDSDTYDERKPFVYNKKKTKKLPTGKAPSSVGPALSAPETETDDSLDYFEDPYEKDEFDILA